MARTASSYPITSWPEEERPREKLLSRGPEALSDAELLAILLRTGTASTKKSALDQARAFLAQAGSLSTLAKALPSELRATKGVGPAKAATLQAAFELARRLSSTKMKKGTQVRTSADVFQHFHGRLRGLKKERFFAVLLDGKNKVIRDVLISEGSLTGSLVHPREVFNPAVRESAASVILVHNHPSGDPTPSEEDRELTRRLMKSGELLGIQVLDHIIIGDGSYRSFADTQWRE